MTGRTVCHDSGRPCCAYIAACVEPDRVMMSAVTLDWRAYCDRRTDAAACALVVAWGKRRRDGAAT